MEKRLFLKEPGNVDRIQSTDIAQGALGDCFFLSALGDIALKDPSFISHDLISHDGHGKEIVHLYNQLGGIPILNDNWYGEYISHFYEDSIAVTNKFPIDAVNKTNEKDFVNGVKEIWPEVVEKAYAHDNLGYANLNNGGYPQNAMETLTGHQAYIESPSDVTLAQLLSFEHSSSAIASFDTPATGNLPYHLVDDHSYMFDGVVTVGGINYVHLRNPWDTREPQLIPVSEISHIFSDVTHGTV